MTSSHAPVSRMLRAIRITALIFSFCAFPVRTEAATRDASIRLRPHCEAELQENCAMYAVKDPLTLQTPTIVPGSILDMDIVVDNPSGQPITRVRAWMSYDPVVFEGKKIEPSKAFPIISPGEADFSGLLGYMQIGLQTAANQPVTDRIVHVARIQLTTKKAPDGGKTVIAFYDVQDAPTGHTVVVTPEGATEANILTGTVGSLLVAFPSKSSQAGGSSGPTASVAGSQGSASSIASKPSDPSDEASSAASAPTAPTEGNTNGPVVRTPFTLLQVQNVRLTTEGSTVYLAWDTLPSTEIAGYNIYYGAETGRYLQRRSIAKEATNTAIRALPLDTTYYFAVRAVNAKDEESAFSQEVAVQVGNPRTSTSPLAVGATDPGPQGRNPLTIPKTRPDGGVPGDTGVDSSLLLLMILSGIIGTIFAFRRQCSASAFAPHG